MKKFIVAFLFALIASLCDAQTPPGGYGPSIGGGNAGGSASSLFPLIDVTLPPYNVKADGNYACTASWTSGLKTVTTLSTERPFLPSDVGSIVYGTNQPCGSASLTATVQIAQGTITGFTDAHTITVSNAASNTCTSVANSSQCILVWGKTDNAVGLNAAFAAGSTLPNCSGILLPPGNILIGQPIVNASGNCNLQANNETGQQGVAVQGVLQHGTFIIPLPSWNGSNCTGPLNSCLFAQGNSNNNGAIYRDFTFFGGGINSITNGTNKILLLCGVECVVQNVNIQFFGTNTAGFTGIQTQGVGNGNSYVQNFTEFSAGNTGCNWAGFVTLTGVQCLGYNNAAPTGSNVQSFGGNYLTFQVGGQGITITGTFQSFGDQFSQSGGAGAAILNQGNVFLSGSQLSCSTGAGGSAMKLQLGGKALVTGSIFTAAGTCVPVINAVGTRYYDLGGNTYTGGSASTGITPTCVFTSGGGATPSCAPSAGSTNEKGTIVATTGTGPGSTGTITLTFSGLNFGGATGIAPACVFNIDNAATVWGNEALVQVNSTSTTTAVVAWANLATAVLTNLTASVSYNIDYTCTPR